MNPMPEDLILQASDNFPYVEFNKEGALSLRGRFLSDRIFHFFVPLFSWVEEIDKEKVEVDLDIEYLPSVAFNGIKELLRLIEINPKIKQCAVCWHYDLDDEEHYDKGIMLKERFSGMEFELAGRADTSEIYLN